MSGIGDFAGLVAWVESELSYSKGRAERLLNDLPDATPVIEAMARAIWDTREARFPRLAKTSWENGTEVSRQCARDEAVAALAAYALCDP